MGISRPLPDTKCMVEGVLTSLSFLTCPCPAKKSILTTPNTAQKGPMFSFFSNDFVIKRTFDS
jgi:hypothetical protein